MSEVTRILSNVPAGENAASEQLFELVYAELRRIASHKMSHEAAGHTLQPTALVHEAWLRLGATSQPHWQSRAHFFAAAAETMRRILVDKARRKLAQRRGAGVEHVEWEGIEIASPEDDEQLVALNEALDRFAKVDAPKTELVKLRYFAGLTIEQVSKTMNISEPTAKRWWAYARAWLFRECRNGS